MTRILDANDKEAHKAWQILVTSAEWRIIEQALRDNVLPRCYVDACARPDNPARDWFAGRAAILHELLDDAARLRERSGRSQMPLVQVGAQRFG